MHKMHHNEEVLLCVTGEKGEPWLYQYRLKAVVVHCGINIDSGHYYTFASDANDNWFKFNDSHISRSSLNELTQSTSLNTPYILFYELAGKQREPMHVQTVEMDAAAALPTSVTLDGGYRLGNGSSQYGGYSPPESNDDDLYDGCLPSSSTEDRADFGVAHTEAPPLESLSMYLQNFVQKDNQSYRAEVLRNHGGRTDFYNFYNGNNRRYDDRDRDPPSTCSEGQNIISSNYPQY